MTTKEELHRLVDRLTEEQARQALDYLRWLAEPGETLSDAEIERLQVGEEESARDDVVALADLRRILDDIS